MGRKPKILDGTSENPNVSLSEEKIEADYNNETVAAPGHKIPSSSQLFPLLAAYWMILLVVMSIHIHCVFLHKSDEQEVKQLQTKNNILTEQIKTMEKTWNEQKRSQAQWNTDEYCPKDKNNNRKCEFCQKGWLSFQSSCYAINNAIPRYQKTWEEAREDCRGMCSDLTVVGDEKEKEFIDGISWADKEIKGYWIGLRAVEGKWKWIEGSDLTYQAWIQHQPANDGQCVTSLQNQDWRSVNCSERNAYICKKTALSV